MVNDKTNGKPRTYCVIGAGTAGLCTARHALQSGGEVTVFEMASQLGGTWVFNEEVDKNEYGIDVHSSMYKGLKTNLPKEIMGYPDFPIPEQDSSYIPAEDMLRFFQYFSDYFGITECIKFSHYVIRIKPTKDEKQWEVIVRDCPNDQLKTFYFDYVLVCNGHYHTPRLPNYPGINLYKGKQMHSHDYRCNDPFVGETVLVIGAGPSGMDMAYEISKKAERVTLSHHLKDTPKTVFPDNVILKHDVARLTETGVVFADGTSQDFSVICYSTGYKYTFPFLSCDCGIIVEDNYVQKLYKHCINIRYPTMAFIGLPYYVCAAQMMDLQARFCIKFFSGEKQLPSQEEMEADTNAEMEERWSRGMKKRQAHMMGPQEDRYYEDLAHTAEVEPIKPVIKKLHKLCAFRFSEDLVNFRKDKFRIIDNETYVKIN
ncbi:senecionine N-oxygenase-like [Armigeres subalbatus]|uniref:senecionine N-oxygenase-like n=1 Tax=Armigeres subalbatus TaxID=124917 RepID=UPI002ED13E3A